MSVMLQSALDTFQDYLDDAANAHAGQVFTTSGRPTKQYPNGEDYVWWRDNGPEQIKAWATWRDQNPDLVIAEFDGAPAIELAVTATIGDVTLRGFVDRVFADRSTGELLIVDLKTGKNTPGSPLQLAFYRVAMEQTVGVSPTHGAYWMSRKGTLSSVEHLWYPTEMIADWLHKVKHMIDSELFVPHMSFLCGSCSVRDHCTAWSSPSSNSNTTVQGESND